MEDDFGVADGIAGGDAEELDEGGRDFGVFEAFDFAAGFADEVGVVMLLGLLFIAEGVAPDTVFAADAVDEFFAGEGVKGAIDGYGIGVGG